MYIAREPIYLLASYPLHHSLYYPPDDHLVFYRMVISVDVVERRTNIADGQILNTFSFPNEKTISDECTVDIPCESLVVGMRDVV